MLKKGEIIKLIFYINIWIISLFISLIKCKWICNGKCLTYDCVLITKELKVQMSDLIFNFLKQQIILG